MSPPWIQDFLAAGFPNWDWVSLPFLWLPMETSQVLHLVKIATLEALFVPSMLCVSIHEDIALAAGTTFQSPNSHIATSFKRHPLFSVEFAT